MEIRWSYNLLISTVHFPILVTWPLDIESVLCFPLQCIFIIVYRIMHELLWITSFGSLMMWFVNNLTCHENYWQMASRLTQKWLSNYVLPIRVFAANIMKPPWNIQWHMESNFIYLNLHNGTLLLHNDVILVHRPIHKAYATLPFHQMIYWRSHYWSLSQCMIEWESWVPLGHCLSGIQ